NYGRCLAKMALYFQCCPTTLPDEQINEYLLLLRDTQSPSYSYFKHTVYGLRMAFRSGSAVNQKVNTSLTEQPFKKARQVINYIGRYSHSIAIGNHRIKNIEGDKVAFSYKNYRKNGQKEKMQLSQWDFICRFARHIVPHRFVRIRHYGILSNRNKGQALMAARIALDAKAPPPPELTKTAFNPLLPQHYCACCKTTTTHLLLEI
ncbi:MAG TPA: transposase, partial [Allomuricauda sp.]|nr:transposase [Allomuricauda sp.]